mgnify:CR=1 FL=1
MELMNHTFEPVYDGNSRVLILGTFPSVKSRENRFYYGHPQNRFWKVTAALTDSPLPTTIEQKKAMLLAGGIAIWDVIASCRIVGSSDSSIRDVTVNDIGGLLEKTDVEAVFCNGDKAFRLYERYCFPVCRKEALKLPSTSPANAAWSLDRLIQNWRAAIGPWLETIDRGK